VYCEEKGLEIFQIPCEEKGLEIFQIPCKKNIYNFLHHCAFKTPALRAVMSGVERLICAF